MVQNVHYMLAKHAVKLAKDENAQLFCIHVIGSVPYYGFIGSRTCNRAVL